MESGHEALVWSISWHPLGHILATGSNDHTVRFWSRNRPGDQMKDKYNLNTLPSSHEVKEKVGTRRIPLRFVLFVRSRCAMA